MSESSYPGVYVEEVTSGVHAIPGVPTTATGVVVTTHGKDSLGDARSAVPGSTAGLERVVSVADYQSFAVAFPGIAAAQGSELSLWVRLFFENGGSELFAVRVPPEAPLASSLTVLDEVLGLGLLCLPGETDAARLTETLAYAGRRGAFLIVDPPADADEAMALARMLAKTGGANAAVYFPGLQVTDSVTGAARTCGPSGAVAGMFARIDRARGVWKAPAGQEAILLGVDGPAEDLDESTMAELTAAGVNPIRTLPGVGTVAWGARTVQGSDGGDPEWKYVNMRRFFVFLENSIDTGTRWAVFEPNDEPLWAKVRTAVGDFLDGLWRSGALPGRTPDEAYFVRCDRSTMTQNDLDNGRLIVEVGVALVRPAEFVIVRIGRWVGAMPLCRLPLMEQGFVLEVEMNGEWTEWTQVGSFDECANDDRVYRLDQEEGVVRFGDGVHGRQPSQGSRFRATYRSGGGEAGSSLSR
jgi:phage tail sheath protein FI